ncbi:MAG: alpha/beta hydrolase [Bacteroidales bacterium]|nr:alpha/beta hydrolase [Bacteroidales bacterium]
MPAIEITYRGQKGEIHIQELNPGATDTIVLVHGMFGNLSQFYLTIAPFLAREFRVLMYDLRSHGRSTCFKTGFDLNTLSEDLNRVIIESGAEKCHLLGFSYGALIVLKYAMRFGEKVNKVIALEIPPRHTLPFKDKGTYTFDDFWAFALSLPPHVRDNFLRSKRQVKNTYNLYENIFNNTSFVEDMNNEKEFSSSDYTLVQAPVQLFFGDHSICLPELERVKNWINKKTISFEQGDHGFFMHRCEQSANKMIEFLQR